MVGGWALGGRKGRGEVAEPRFKGDLASDKKGYGDEQPDVALGLDNLAQLYKGQASSAIPLTLTTRPVVGAGECRVLRSD